MRLTRYERRQRWKRKRNSEIAEHILMIILGAIFLICVIAFCCSEEAAKANDIDSFYALEEAQKPLIRGIPEEYYTVSEHETYVTESMKSDNIASTKTDIASPKADKHSTVSLITDKDELQPEGFVYVSSDTPELDEESDQFELLCQIVMDEGGYTEPDEGIRMMADGVLNRVDSPLFPNSIAEVINQPGQFQPVSSGTFYDWVPTERVIQICAQEMENRTYKSVLFWRTGHYHAGTTPIAHIGHHYYSGR